MKPECVNLRERIARKGFRKKLQPLVKLGHPEEFRSIVWGEERELATD